MNGLSRTGLLGLAWITLATATPAVAQRLEGPPASPELEYSTPMPPGVAAPDEVETRLGTLRFDSGVPDEATTSKRQTGQTLYVGHRTMW